MDEIIPSVFKEYFNLKKIDLNDSIVSLGGDSLDTIEIAIFIEDEYGDSLNQYEIDDEFLDSFAYRTIENLIKEVPNHLIKIS